MDWRTIADGRGSAKPYAYALYFKRKRPDPGHTRPRDILKRERQHST